MGIKDILPLLLNLSTRWDKWSIAHIGRFSPRGKSPRYTLNRRLGGPQSRSQRYGEEENFLPVESNWNVMAHGDAREVKWRRNWRVEWVASTLHTTSQHGLSSITTADTHPSAASSRLKWRRRRFKWTRPFRRKTKYGFCACAITFQTQFTDSWISVPQPHVLWPSCYQRYPDSKKFQERQFLFYFPRKTVFDFLKFAFEYRLFFISRISDKASVQEYHLIKKTRRRGTVIIVLGMSRFVVVATEIRVKNTAVSIEGYSSLQEKRTVILGRILT